MAIPITVNFDVMTNGGNLLKSGYKFQIVFLHLCFKCSANREELITMAKNFEAYAWPGYWEGTKPIVNFKTPTQKLKFSFLQRDKGDFVCVFNTGDEMIEYLDMSPFTGDKYFDSSGYYNWI